MGPFTSHPDDLLWRFKIEDLFPHNDELARHILMILAANEDLSNIERFKTLLEAEKPRAGIDEIAQAKWNRGHFFLAKLRLGFLHNVWKDILGEENKIPPLTVAVSSLGDDVRQSYETLRNVVNSCRRTKNILNNFRNRTSFHYDQRQLEAALEVGADDTGKIIEGNSDVHFIVAYQVLDLIPAGRLPREEISKIKDEIEFIQNKFHEFVSVLFPAYIQHRSLMKKVEITKSPSEDKYGGLMEPQFHFYYVEPFDTVLRPFVVTTAYSKPGCYPKGEWFLAIPDEKNSFFSQATTFNTGSFRGSPISLDANFILQEVYEQAQVKLRQYLFDKCEARGRLELFPTPRLVEAEPKALVHYRLRDECSQQLTFMLKQTECEPLRSYLEAIQRLPPIVRHDL